MEHVHTLRQRVSHSFHRRESRKAGKALCKAVMCTGVASCDFLVGLADCFQQFGINTDSCKITTYQITLGSPPARAFVCFF